jgi:hypothetical protein
MQQLSSIVARALPYVVPDRLNDDGTLRCGKTPAVKHLTGERPGNSSLPHNEERRAAQAVRKFSQLSCVLPGLISECAPCSWSACLGVEEDVERLFGGFFGPASLLSSDRPSDLATIALGPRSMCTRRRPAAHSGGRPGLEEEDAHVDVHELCISGERRSESSRSEGCFYRTERSYGSFFEPCRCPKAQSHRSRIALRRSCSLRQRHAY